MVSYLRSVYLWVAVAGQFGAEGWGIRLDALVYGWMTLLWI